MTKSDLDKKIEEMAATFVDNSAKLVFKALDAAGIHYSDELLCHAWEDSFKAGAQAIREILEPENAEITAKYNFMMDSAQQNGRQRDKAEAKLQTANARIENLRETIEQYRDAMPADSIMCDEGEVIHKEWAIDALLNDDKMAGGK